MEEGTETPKYDHLTVYSPLPESETLLYCSAFRKDTGITVDCIHLPAGEMTARLEQERDNPQASVLLGGSADNYIQLREAGLLEAYQSPELTDVPEAYHDEQGVWNPIYIGTLCFACNTDWFARTGTPIPTCWDDLLSPALAGQIVMATRKARVPRILRWQRLCRCAERTRHGSISKVRSECRSILYCIEYRTG